jgi:hypothetical protein
MKATRTESRDNITDVATTEEKTGRMGICLHGSAEGLLTENRKRIGIINENPAVDTGFYRDTANKFRNGFTNTVNSTVLIGANLETPVWIFKLDSAASEIVRKKIGCKSCFT